MQFSTFLTSFRGFPWLVRLQFDGLRLAHRQLWRRLVAGGELQARAPRAKLLFEGLLGGEGGGLRRVKV